MAKVCECGNNRFYARQVCRLDIIVDGSNNFQGNAHDGSAEASIYDSETPYGPYECTKCGKTCDDLKELEEDEQKKQNTKRD